MKGITQIVVVQSTNFLVLNEPGVSAQDAR